AVLWRRGYGRNWLDLARNVSVRHHHDHRLRFSVGDQIIENHISAPGPRPRCLDLSVAMQQVEDWILLLSGFVPWRCIDIEHPLHSEIFWIVELDVHAPVRRGPVLENLLLDARYNEIT